MATDVKNNAAGDTGASQNGKITVQANRNNYQYQDPLRLITFTIANFDLNGAGQGTILADRFDDPRYYTGDAAT